MRTRLAGIALAAAMAGISGCGAPADKKIALQIEPTPQLGQSPQSAPREALPDAANSALAHGGNTTADQAGTAADPAGALARKTESYAKTMQSAIDHHAAPKATPPQDSLVQWINPNEFRIGSNEDVGDTPTANASPATPANPAAQAPAPAPAPDKEVKPTMQVAMTQANRGASVETPARSDGSNSPAVIPPEPSADKASAMIPGALEALETRVTKRLKDYPRDVSANLDYQLMLFLRDEPVPQLSSLTSLPTEDRELVSAVMDGLSNFRSTLRSDNNMLYSRKIRPLADLTDRLKQQAELSIPMLVLCSKVDGFGRYDPIEPARFPAQRPTQAIIYCELENFASQENAAKMYQTDVTQEAVLYTEDGMQVWADKTQTIQDLSRHRRHDFFLRTLVKFPETLTMGRYMLKVSVVDRQANRVAEASLPIQIISQ